MSTDFVSVLLASAEETEKDAGSLGSQNGSIGELAQIPEEENRNNMSTPPLSSITTSPPPAKKPRPNMRVDMKEQSLQVFGEVLPLLFAMHERASNKGAEMQFIFGPRKLSTKEWSQCFAECATAQLVQPFDWIQFCQSIKNTAHPFSCFPTTEASLRKSDVKYVSCRHPTNLERGGYSGSLNSVWVVEFRKEPRGKKSEAMIVYFFGVFFPNLGKTFDFLRKWQEQFPDASLEAVETALMQVRIPAVTRVLPLDGINARLANVAIPVVAPPTATAQAVKTAKSLFQLP